MTIWKFRLRGIERQTISMPRGAKILTVQMQHGDAQVWAIVDPAQEHEHREFAIVGTGHPINFDVSRYIGTLQMNAGSFVFHVFDLTC